MSSTEEKKETKPVGKKPSGLAAAGAEIVQPAPKLKIKEKDALQKKVFNSQVQNFSQNAFITGVNGLGMSLEVSNCRH